MREWTSLFSPFDSRKALCWKARLDLFRTGTSAPAPVTLDVEPTNGCNLRCSWCFPRGFRQQAPGHMDTDRLLEIPAFAREWGVEAVQVTGGGEPTLHPAFDDFLAALVLQNVRWSLITNGTRISTMNAELIGSRASWCGVSVDAGTSATWAAVKGKDAVGFHDVVTNVERLVRASYRGQCQVCFKFLLGPQNAGDILAAARLAGELGCADLHIRPAYGLAWDDATRRVARAQLEELASWPATGPRRHVVSHKFGVDGTPQARFERCIATPLLLVLCADNDAYICQDHRGEAAFKLCDFGASLHAVREAWGSPNHRRMTANVDPRKCGKCTMSGYNEVLAQATLDALHVSFL